jgi:hypothetical protein
MGTNLATLGIRAMEETEGYRRLRRALAAQAQPYAPDAVGEAFPGTETETAMAPFFVLQRDDPWLARAASVQARDLILNFNGGRQRGAKHLPLRRLEWPLKHEIPEPTGFELVPVFNKLDEDTAQHVAERDLTASVAWLQAVTPRFFDGADFEIELLPAEDGEESLLALKVYGAFDPSEFRRRRHRICEAMLAADHRGLHEVISIFQRRVADGGWQAFSWYGSLSAE